MKRSLGTAEIANVRRVVPATTEDSDSPAEPASDAPALAALPETAPSEHPPMAFPGPYAFFPKPAAMQDGAKTSASTSSAETVTDTENPNGFPPLILAASMGKLAELEILL